MFEQVFGLQALALVTLDVVRFVCCLSVAPKQVTLERQKDGSRQLGLNSCLGDVTFPS